MTPLLAALAASAVGAGLLLAAAGLRPVPPAETGRPGRGTAERLRQWSLLANPARSRGRLLLAVAAGGLAWLLTGWPLLVVLVPLATLGVPWLLARPTDPAGIARLEGLEEWTRNLAGVLAVGVGLEQAITASLRSAPEVIRPQVAALVARLSARWPTETALRAFADELADPTGDLVAASLILSARRRGTGLVAVLDGLATSVAEDVRARRAVEADRAKPRATARAVTAITLGVLGLLALNPTYIAPYGTPLGQLLLATLLTGYVAALLWMRQMTRPRPAPRLLTPRPADPGPSHGPALDRGPVVAVRPPAPQVGG